MLSIKVNMFGQEGGGTADVKMDGTGREILIEAGALVEALVGQVIETAYETNRKNGNYNNNKIIEQGIGELAGMMQFGFREGIERLKKKGILNADYGEDIEL